MFFVNKEKETTFSGGKKKNTKWEGQDLHTKTLKYSIIWGSIKYKKRDLTFDDLNDLFGKV